MNSANLRQSSVRNEAELYDDLSLFIQIFKRSLCLLELIVINIQKQNEFLPQINKTKQAVQELSPLLQKYSTESGRLSIELITFHRFVCRLMQTITLYKMKYRSLTNSPALAIFLRCLVQLENAIRRNEQEILLAKMIKAIQISLIKFCISCERNNSERDVRQRPVCSENKPIVTNDVGRSKKSEKLATEKYSYDKCMSEDEGERDDEQPHYVERERKGKLSMLSHPLSDIQKRFCMYKEMDLDFKAFKSSYFEANSSTSQFQKNYLERNSINGRIISIYYDDFNLFQKRREDRLNRKNRRIRFKADRSMDQIIEYDRQECKQAMRMRRNRNNQTYDEKMMNIRNGNVHRQLLQKQDVANINTESSKVSYKLKNVYITLNKKKNNARQVIKNDAISPTSAKKKAGMQPISINQSYYNGLDYNTSNSIQFLHSKLKIETLTRHDPRIKTEADKIGSKYDQIERHKLSTTNGMLSEKTVIGFVNSPIQSIKKGKYLQINCVGNHRQTNTKSRTVLLGLNTQARFPIRAANKTDISHNNRFMQLRQV